MFAVQNQKPKRTKIPEKTIHKKFKSDFNDLYETKRNSDVILLAANQEFSAHKAILTARSVVFAAMFENPMRESVENKVEINDINPEVLEVMLLFIYTGNVKNMDKIGTQLMSAADKYGLEQLKIICSRHLITNMSLNTAIESLILSELMDDSDLKRCALEFIRDNPRDVVKNKDWINLKKNYSELLDEIFLFSTNNHSIKAKIRFHFLKDLKTGFKRSQMSEINKIHGIPWKILVKPKKKSQTIEDQQVVAKYLGVYLVCCLKEPSDDFSCDIRGEIKLMSLMPDIPDITKKINKTYNQFSMKWGFDQFERLDIILDSKYGFFFNGLLLEANIIVEPPKGGSYSNVVSDGSDKSEAEDLSSAEDQSSPEDMSSVGDMSPTEDLTASEDSNSAED